MSTDIIWTPVGRLVQGSPWEAHGKTSGQGGAPVLGKDGQQRMEYYCGLFVANDESFQAFWAQVNAIAQTEMAQSFQSPNFAWKVQQGDPSKVGQDAQGYLIRSSTGFAPQVVDENGAILNDPESLKRGYYVRMAVTVSGNQSTQSPGLYINTSMVQRVAYGEVIVSGPSPEELLRQAPAIGQLPAGASTAPLTPVMTPAAPQQQAPVGNAPAAHVAAPIGLPSAQVAPTVPNGTAPIAPSPSNAPAVPHHGFVQGAGQQ